MKTFEEKFTAWVDGQLAGKELAEFEQELASHPEALKEKESLQRMGQFLRNNPAPPIGNPDFFNHQLLQRIAADTVVHQEKAAPRAEKVNLFFWKRLVLAGAACLLVAMTLFKVLIPVKGPATPSAGVPYFAQVVEAWPAGNNISATTVYNPDTNVTVLWLDGLDFIPANQQIH